MDIALYVIGTIIAVLVLGMGALGIALLLALGIRFMEGREQDQLAEQKTIPPPRPKHEPPPIPADHARVMIRPRQPTLKELKDHRSVPPPRPAERIDTATPVTVRQTWHEPPPRPLPPRPPMFKPEPAAVTPEVPPLRPEEDASDLPTDGNNDRPRGKWDDDPTEDGPNLTLLSELTNPPTPERTAAPKAKPRRSMFGSLFKGNRPK